MLSGILILPLAPPISLVLLSAEYSEFVHARDQLMGLAGASVVIAYAAFVVAGEPAHEAAHPHYQAPYSFSKRNMETGAGWWPGRHCQFFEFNCFAAAYEEAEEMLHQQEHNQLTA